MYRNWRPDCYTHEWSRIITKMFISALLDWKALFPAVRHCSQRRKLRQTMSERISCRQKIDSEHFRAWLLLLRRIEFYEISEQISLHCSVILGVSCKAIRTIFLQYFYNGWRRALCGRITQFCCNNILISYLSRSWKAKRFIIRLSRTLASCFGPWRIFHKRPQAYVLLHNCLLQSRKSGLR